MWRQVATCVTRTSSATASSAAAATHRANRAWRQTQRYLASSSQSQSQPQAASARIASSNIRLSNDIRSSFLSYFESHGHTRVAASSVVPSNDPTLLFTNAGMVQFKDMFTGVEAPPSSWTGGAVSAQKCIRAGGKHNDLDNVGYTARHHTLFEMMGNFAFGHYFKEQAIVHAWNYLTKTVGLPVNRLGVTVYEDDDESASLWKKVTGWHDGDITGRIARKGKEDNFWSMGDGPGPCGPCTEIFWDQQKEVDGERFLEVWNLVFMQYARGIDGKLTPLSRPCVDTGMGLERMAAVLQGVPTNYDIDSMSRLVHATLELAARRRSSQSPNPGMAILTADMSNWSWSNGLDTAAPAVAARVIADHVRAVCFMVADGIIPAAVGRGYVLRRIIRRAVTFGTKLGIHQPFLVDLIPTVAEVMGDAYPELKDRTQLIASIIGNEEATFYQSLPRGLRILDQEFKKAATTTSSSTSSKTLSGNIAFTLWDSHAFPLDLTQIICRDKGWNVDVKEFDAAMEKQQVQSRAGGLGHTSTATGDTSKAPTGETIRQWRSSNIRPTFTGLIRSEEPLAKIIATSPVTADGVAWIAIEPCPFYPMGGGQIGDKGILKMSNSTTLSVIDAMRPYDGGLALKVVVPPTTPTDTLTIGSELHAIVDPNHRRSVAHHHTATHILHAALRHVIGTTVTQAGSYVAQDRLRFDFTHGKALTREQIVAVEAWMDKAARSAAPVNIAEMDKKAALSLNAMALFSENYGDTVRVVTIPGWSTELCGGTHTSSSRDCYPIRIVSDGPVAAGIRRIEAVAGDQAIEWLSGYTDSFGQLATTMKTTKEELPTKIASLRDAKRDLEKQVSSLRLELFKAQPLPQLRGTFANGTAETAPSGTPIVIHLLPTNDDIDSSMIGVVAQQRVTDDNKSIHILLTVTKGSITIAAAKPANAAGVLRELVRRLTALGHKDARGGGRPNLAQGSLPVHSDLAAIVLKALTT